MKRLLVGLVAVVVLAVGAMIASAETDGISQCSVELQVEGKKCQIACGVGTAAICERGDGDVFCRCGETAQILTGSVAIHHEDEGMGGLWNVDAGHCPTGEAGQRGERNGRVDFAKPFSSPPVVLMGFTGLDFAHDRNLRISAQVKKVDKEGFDYMLVTWCNTRVWWTRASWIAIAD